jgi:hypothetical protein
MSSYWFTGHAGVQEYLDRPDSEWTSETQAQIDARHGSVVRSLVAFETTFSDLLGDGGIFCLIDDCERNNAFSSAAEPFPKPSNLR